MPENSPNSGPALPGQTPDSTDLALFTDLYELTMLQTYFNENLFQEAVFSLFMRRLPQAHEDETAAFKAFLSCYPETVLLGDTYDTLAGIRKIIEIARTLGSDFKVRGVRLDSGDLLSLSRDVRQALDGAGLYHVEIFASGNLDEYRIAQLAAAGAPINGFGVGTHMGVSLDLPCLDIAYKLCEYAGKGRMKLSSGKPVLPAGRMNLEAIRRFAKDQTACLPDPVKRITPAAPPFPVEISPMLGKSRRKLTQELLS